MDRGSHFFYALEKRRGAKKHVTCLLAEDGTPLMDLVEMCGRARAFYASLFSLDPNNPNACRVLWEELPMVSTGDRDRLELPLTLAEFSEAHRRMPTNISPGMDGLTVEFYRIFWDVVGPDLVTIWAEFLQSGVLPLSCSTDYRFIAKAISLRLASMLVDVVHPDQTYTIPGCSIFDNLYLVRDLLELGCRDECLVRLNWTLTEPVSFGQGVRQGCPLSGQLYALVIKPFLCLLRRRLMGLVLREPELRLVLLA
ncbi:unnamed protein product [Caretta caretta]